MPLQAHPFNRAVKSAKVAVPTRMVEQAQSAGSLPIANRDIDAEIFLPADEGVAHQAGNVVGDGAIDRVLKIEHT